MQNDEPVAPGEAGELQFRGPNITPGYFGNEAATRAAFAEGGWLKTGDVARADTDGYVFIVDRIKDMYISGGENVYPAEVESLLATHPDILEAAVIGVPDERWGEVGRAFLLPRPGRAIDTAALTAWCRERIAAYKVPKAFEIVDDFPAHAGRQGAQATPARDGQWLTRRTSSSRTGWRRRRRSTASRRSAATTIRSMSIRTFSARTRFGHTVAHGMLLYSRVWAMLRRHYPAPAPAEPDADVPQPHLCRRRGALRGACRGGRGRLPDGGDLRLSSCRQPTGPARPDGAGAGVELMEIGQRAELRRTYQAADLTELARSRERTRRATPCRSR